MNVWTKESIEIANAPGYLDQLSEVYKMQVNERRPMPKNIKLAIVLAFKEKNTRELIRLLLLYAPVFPVKDSYLGFIRAKEGAIDQNPLTVSRIGERLYSLGIDELLEDATRPKETNRQLGSAFKSWLPTMGYPILEEENFDTASGTVILEGGDKTLKKYAISKLGCRLRKGIDILIKKDDKYIIGEAKFLTTPGGEQDRGFDDASNFVKNRTGRAIRIALLDGYVWLESTQGLHDKIVRSDENVFSALLLKKFIESLN